MTLWEKTKQFATKNIPYALIQVGVVCNPNKNLIIPCKFYQAAIIVVYTYGLMTLMARNFDDADSAGFMTGIVNYFPIIPSLQVRIAQKLQ